MGCAAVADMPLVGPCSARLLPTNSLTVRCHDSDRTRILKVILVAGEPGSLPAGEEFHACQLFGVALGSGLCMVHHTLVLGI